MFKWNSIFVIYPSSKKISWKKISYTEHDPIPDSPITSSF